MKILAQLVITIMANGFALLTAPLFIPDLLLLADIENLLFLALILTALNLFLKPILKLVLGPLIVLTLGFGLVAVNMTILFLLDILSPSLTIQGNYLWNIFLLSLLISIINTIVHWGISK